MDRVWNEARTQATLSRLPLQRVPRAKQRIFKKKLASKEQAFHGNKAYQLFRRYRDIHQQMKVWQQHHEPDIFYELEYNRKKLKGSSKDDWHVHYWAMSPTYGESVAVEWLHDTKSTNSMNMALADQPPNSSKL